MRSLNPSTRVWPLRTIFQLGGGNPALPEMRFPRGRSVNVSVTRWRSWPSATLLKAPGCYAWHIDRTAFSIVVVFKAKIGR